SFASRPEEAAATASPETPPETPPETSAGGLATGQAEPFPGDAPTRIEPVSAALLDKMRERDDEAARTAGEMERTQESLPPQMETPAAEPRPEANVTMQDFSMPGVEEPDPDEGHWRETFEKFRELKTQLGEPADRITFE